MILKSRPMTPAERQRKCRARGKGRHRGGGRKLTRVEARRLMERALAAAGVTLEQPGSTPDPQPQIEPQLTISLGISAMAA